MKDLIIAWCELGEYDEFSIDNASIDDAIWFIDLGWVANGKPTNLGLAMWDEWAEELN